MSSARDGLVCFLATLVGAFAVVSGIRLPVIGAGLVAIAAAGLVFRSSSEANLKSEPERAVRLMQGYLLWSFAVVAATTVAGALTGLKSGEVLAAAPDWLVDPSRLTGPDGNPSAAATTAASLLAGAIGSLAGVIFTKGATDATSAHWPGGAARAAFGRVFGPLVGPPPPDTATPQEVADFSQVYDAVHDDEASDAATGWDLPALDARIAILRRLRPGHFPSPRP